MAMQYHPDKNAGDKIADAHFKEIKEAYETLTHPGKREAYNQQRWYNQSIGRRFANIVPLTPDSFLQECLFLDRYVCTLVKFRIDNEGLYQYITNLLSYDKIDTLKEFNDARTNLQIISTLLNAAASLPYKYAVKLVERLMLLAANDEEILSSITRYADRQKKISEGEKNKIIIIVFIVLIICMVIYTAGKG